MKTQILSLKNQYNETAGNIEPQFIIQSAGTKSTKKLVSGENISWLLSETKHCAGYNSNGGYLACPSNNTVEPNYEMCASCDTKLGFRSAFFFGGPPNDLMKEYLGSKHYVYLTFFQPNILKVGTAKHSRRLSRLIEQDALFAFFIAETNGFDIQKIEKHISQNYGLTEMVYSRQKFKHIGTKIDRELANQQLTSVLDRFKNDPAVHKFFIEELPITIDNIDNQNIVYPKDIEIVKIENKVQGKFLGIRGKYLILEYEGQSIAISTKQITGRYFSEVEPKEGVYKLKSSGQLGMF